MPTFVEGRLTAPGKRFAVVVSRWNNFFGEQLLTGAMDALVRQGGVDAETVHVVRCPGAFEIPLVVAKLAESKKFDAVIALGVLIRGATPHFDYIAAEATKGIAQVSMQTGVPISYGVITCDTMEQAIERSGSKAGNKGAEAAMAAIEMVNLFDGIDQL